MIWMSVHLFYLYFRYIKHFLSANPQLLKDNPDIVKNLPFINQSEEILEDNFLDKVDLDKLQKCLYIILTFNLIS